MARTCIIVSPYFPPSTLAGVHRARHLAKHLPATGWTPIIVCVDEAFHEERLDPGLAALVPRSVEVVKVPALSPRYCRPLGVGEISVRAWRPLRRAVMNLLGTRKIDLVLITGSPYYPMLLGPEIKRRFGVPVVLDFQDPWVSAWAANQPRLSKTGVSHRLAEWLEPMAVRAADFITSVSKTQNEEMRTRYPNLSPDRMAAITIGGDPEDYDALRARGISDGLGLVRPGSITLSYVGTFMPRTEPLLRVFLSAFAQVRSLHPQMMANVRLLFVGTSNQPNDTTTKRVMPLAQAAGVADAVAEVPQRVPYLDAIGVLAQSHGLILIGSDEPHYTASKIYPGLMSGRPYVSLFHRDSSSHTILSGAGGGLALAFSNNTELAAMGETVAAAIYKLAAAPDTLGCTNPAAYAAYTATAIAKEYAGIFARLVDRPGLGA